MKTNLDSCQTHPVEKERPSAATSGVALVLVLGMIALLTLLVIAFLSSASSDLQSAKSYASGSDARSLADSAVNIVISQIQDATADPTLAWASQPGMVRTYDDKGNAKAAYKLYSATTLRADGAYNPLTSLATEIPDSWAASPSLYVDLNKPVNSIYPIVDPSAVGTAQNKPAEALDGTTKPIQGCFINSPTTAITKTSATQTNPIPLPVQWLYVLKDGTVSSVDPGTQKVTGAGATLADGSVNTITGRIGFWADDETCKVNVNTASEGTYWDRPWGDGALTGYERNLSKSLPMANEFQRYPGHPATTSLSTIFPLLGTETVVAYNERMYGITPRVVGGGSKSGTVKTDSGSLPTPTPPVPDTQRLFASVDEFMFQAKSPAQAGSTTRVANPSGTATTFTPKDIEKTRFFLTANSRAPEVNLFNKPRIALWPLQANTTTVSDPLNATNRNASDKLIAFCSTIGTKPYYFQRYNTYDQSQDRSAGATQSPIPSSQSPTMDWSNVPRNRELYTYLQSLTSSRIPGLGGILGGTAAGSKYSLAVRDQILTEMIDYIRSSVNTFSTDLYPGYTYAPFPKNASGWVTGEGQVVPLEISQSGYTTKGFGRFPTVTQAALVFYRTDKRYYQMGASAAATDPYIVMPGSGTVPGQITTTNGDIPIGDSGAMRVVLLLQPFNPTPGLPPWSANVRYSVSGLSGMTVNGSQLSFPEPATNLIDAQEGYYDATALSGFELATTYWQKNTKTLATGPVSVGTAAERLYYPFCSGTITFPRAATTLALSGGSITIKIYQGYATALNPGDLVQTINMTFPAMPTLPVPHVLFGASYSTTTGVTTITSDNDTYIDFDQRMNAAGVDDAYQHNIHPYIRSFDTVRSVQARYLGPALGDYRMIAGLANVPATYFEAHGEKDPTIEGTVASVGYNSSTALVHSLRYYVSNGNEQTGKSNGFYNGSGMTIPYAAATGGPFHGRLAQYSTVLDLNASGGYRPNRAPVAPQGLNGAWQDETASGVGTRLGDWDTGPGMQIDGPYVNKADEGNAHVGYYNTGGNTTAGTIIETGASFSPTRQIPSAVAFGSLPTGIDPTNAANSKPWQTLLFCANPAANPPTPAVGTIHPGFGIPVSGSALGPNAAPPYATPPDHAFLDLFNMPVVEPYAISEPFSTAGKVNMNYQMVPFTYLTRNTAVRAVLKGTNVTAIHTTLGQSYKSGTSVQTDSQLALTDPPCFRFTIDPDELIGTLCGFENRFTTGDIFRSASEICNIYFVPLANAGTSTDAVGPAITANRAYSTMAKWWQGTTIANTLTGMKLTGDNLREAPYASVYPRLTTKSNTYTVHVISQSLKKVPRTPVGQFVEGTDQVTGEFRGSFVVQRYLDPNSDSLVLADGKTPGTETDPNSMVGPYKFRVVSSKRFAP